MELVRRKLYTVDEDTGKVSLHFHPGQTTAWDSIARYIFVIAGNRSGKTSFAPWWLYREIMNTWDKNGGNDYLAVSSTNDLFNNAFLPAMIEVFEEILKIGHYWAATRVLEIKCLDPNDKRYMQFYQGPTGRSTGLMWGRVILRSAQSEGSLESMTAKAALLDEAGQDAFGVEHWEAVQRRVGLPVFDHSISAMRPARILITTTPYNFGWLYEGPYQLWLDGDEDYDVIQFPSYLNPAYDKAEYERAKRTMPDWRFSMFYDGKFERPAGLIYRDFDEATMLVEDFDIPLHWERVVGVDFGGANVATVWLALNPSDGRWYVYDETLMGHMPITEHAAIAEAKSEGVERLTAVGGARSEGQHRTDWWVGGFYIEEPPVFDVEVGIARVTALIKRDKLRVFRSLTRLRREIKTYRRKLDANNEPTEQIISKNRFHVMDGLRYAGAWIEEGNSDVEVVTYDEMMEQIAREKREKELIYA